VAAEAFGAARGLRARDRLQAQLADPDGRVVAQALQALQRIVRRPIQRSSHGRTLDHAYTLPA